MKKLFLIFLLLLNPFTLMAAIDERKTDVYFANGILTEEETAYSNAGLLRESIKEKFGTTYYTQHIGEVTYAYNETHGFWQDIKESGYKILNIIEFVE